MSEFFFFKDTATTEIYTLSLHDALPISCETPEDPRPPPSTAVDHGVVAGSCGVSSRVACNNPMIKDRKSTRLNSSHANISYAVFCLKKKNQSIARTTLLSNTSTLCFIL